MKYFIYVIILLFCLWLFFPGCNDNSNEIIIINSDWSNQTSGVNNSLKSVQFLDSYNGYAIGSSFPNDSGKFLWTSNGGNS